MKWYETIKEKVASLVIRAEQSLTGKSGEEKKKSVIDALCENVSLPGPLNWFKRPLLSYLVGKAVDQICSTLNVITDHTGFADIKIDSAVVAVVATLPKSAALETQDITCETKQETVDARIAELFVQYGITAEETPGTAKGAAAQSYFARSEFACKCGCGTNKVKQDLIDTLNVIRADLGVPITVTSGTRCAKRNAAVGGVTNSNHMSGDAADIQAKGISAEKVWQRIKALHMAGRLPKMAGLGRYKTFNHIDISPKQGILREWDER